ncbi:MAG: thioredoxin family protein [Lewinella sp.]|jgi:thioredoxin-related protein|uniref:thioredoxin family protein n=1 Tax=Lewinella sp. TaxID=2004506 RepID=UPI003D6BA8BC
MAFSFCAKTQSELPIKALFTGIDSLQLVAPRPMVVFLHTDWCRYCQNMQQTTLRDPDVNVLLNDHFYFLSLNAETEETIIFGNQSFPFQPTGNGSGVHTLATTIGTINGQLQYPTLVIMNENYEIIFQHGAFIPADMFLDILTATLK